MNKARLKAALDLKGVKQGDLAAAVGVNEGQVTKWKEGQVPNGSALVKICRYLGCSPGYLFGDDDWQIREFLAIIAENELGQNVADIIRTLPGTRRLPLVTEGTTELKGPRVRQLVSEKPHVRAAKGPRRPDRSRQPRRRKEPRVEKPSADDGDDS